LIIFFRKTHYGQLIITDHFKDEIFDPRLDFVEECAENDSYQIIRHPVIVDDVHKAIREMNKSLLENLTGLMILKTMSQEYRFEVLRIVLETI
jgi:hypothetical protein